MKPLVSGALLVGAWLGAPSLAAQTPAAEAQKQEPSPEQKALDEIVARYQKNRKEAREAYNKAKDDAERQAAVTRMTGAEFRGEFEAFARQHEGQDIAVPALLWVFRIAQDKDGKLGVLRTLSELYMESPGMSDVASELRYASDTLGADAVRKTLGDIVEFSSHEKARGTALYVLGSVLLSEAKTEAEKSEGRKCLERVIAEFGQVATRGGTLGQEAEGWLFELDHLQIGMLAPDFEAVDENGTKWKLSDYRGKVVVVDFWGYW